MKTNPALTRKIFPLVLILALILSISISSFAAKQERKISNFTELEVSSAFIVALTQGPVEKLMVEADEADIDDIITEVRGGKLIIKPRNTNFFSNKFQNVRIYLTFTQLTDIEVSGAVELKGTNVMKFNDLEIEGSGASKINLNLSAARLNCDISGASSVNLMGSASSFEMDLSGASMLDALDLTATICDIDASGASTAKVKVSQKLMVEGSGSSSIQYAGSPAVVEKDISGAASVKKIN
ncbi:MAG: head GIN domain-containing protein [Lentimicrobium sp.]|jgi:hypothetical protein|nr:head GIN domain-containing protein [Lentimicrobium sp.]